MKIGSFWGVALACLNLVAATPVVTSVTAQQRYPWNGNVDIVVAFSGVSNDVARAECVFAATNSATKAALPVAHVTPVGEVAGSGTTWTRRFVWDATADVGEVKIADVALAVGAEMPLGGVQLWENGPYWAECNVGATKPEEYGYYFWWGDTVGYTREGGTYDSSYPRYTDVTWVSSTGTRMSSSPFSSSTCPTYNKSTSTLQSQGYIDSTGNLVAKYDAATAHLGAPWRMPTSAEIDALISNCTTTWTTRNGVYGRLVTGKGAYASKSIFLPAAGYGDDSSLSSPGSRGSFWSSTSYSGYSSSAWDLYFYSGDFSRDSSSRSNGRPVRPLRGFSTASIGSFVPGHLALDTRTGTRYARAEEPITFSTDWSEGTTRLVLNVDGANVLTATTATNGVYVWKPDLSTVRTVTVKHTTRGTVNEALTATFTTAAYDVTFDAGAHGAFSGDGAAVQRVPHGEAATAPVLVPATGYRFTGWSVDTSNVTGSFTTMAQYEAIPYTITYEDLYGATHGNPFTYTIEDTVTFTAPGSIPRRQFVRWEPASIAAGSTGAVTVRAIWETMPCVYVDAGQGNDAWDGSLADRAVKTLARAYELAEPGDVILVAAGTYGPVTATGKAVTFRGADGATIDGGGTDRCVTADADVVFENFTIQNGYDAEAGGGVYGGTFERCTIRDCVSEWDGGGAYEATLRNCVIVGNEAVNGWGGGAYGGTLDHCVVKDNVAGDEGGGVYEPVSLSDTTLSGNLPEDTTDVGGIVTAGGSSVYVPSGSSTIHSIPHDWLIAAGLMKAGESTAGLDAKLAAPYADGYTGWEAFVAGLTARDPAFCADVEMVDGEVRISWTPNLNTGAANRIYAVLGRTDLDKGEWETPVQPWHRFFKVTVAMPTGAAGERSAVAGEGFVPEEKPLGGVQLWENGPYWAECNVGATKPEEYGYYFWWGDTVGYTCEGGTWTSGYYYLGVTWVSSTGTCMSSSPFGSSSCPTWAKSNSTLQSQGYIDSTGNLVAKYDAATAHLGAPWRMPTSAEIDALINCCTITWTTRNGVYGQLVTGKGAYASKSIFLPAAGDGCDSYFFSPGSDGRYWSSSPNSDYSGSACCLLFGPNDPGWGYSERSFGFPVRPLRGFAK